MKIQWEQSYSTGNEILDEQHRKWIGYYNQLHEAMMGQSITELSETKSEILKNVSEYTAYHFQYEEDFMREIGFPGIDKHWRMHKDFREKIYRLYRDHQEGLVVLNSEIMDVLKSWILDHIVEQDGRIIEFLKAQKKKPPNS